MKVSKGRLDGILVIEPKVFGDSRGFFMESYSLKKYAEFGMTLPFVQDNHSLSCRNTVRGLHFQINPGQDKLVRVTRGKVYDVVVDIRKESPTYGQWEGFYLSADNMMQLFVPKGFAHGFTVVSDHAEFLYKCTEYYSPADERGIAWDDPEVGVEWPIEGKPIVSDRDQQNPTLKELPDYF